MLLRTLSRSSSKTRKTRHSYLIVTATSKEIKPARTTQLPIELLDSIIELVLLAIPLDSPRARFASISPFSLASVSFRQIAFRVFFRTLCLKSVQHWNGLYKLMTKQDQRTEGHNGFILIKTIVTSAKILIRDPLKLRSLTNLHTLGIIFETEGLSTQHSCLQLLCPNLASGKLTYLIMTSLPRIDAPMLQQVARSFPCLISLNLSVIERLDVENDRCPCWCCFEDVLETCFHSPIPEAFGDVESLAHAFGSALKPLANLTRLHLGIFLSPEALIYDHAGHHEEDLFSEEGMTSSPADCLHCEERFYEEVREDELLASKIIAEKIRSLQIVSWSTYFYRSKTQDRNWHSPMKIVPERRTSSRKRNVAKDGMARFSVCREKNQVVVVKRKGC